MQNFTTLPWRQRPISANLLRHYWHFDSHVFGITATFVEQVTTRHHYVDVTACLQVTNSWKHYCLDKCFLDCDVLNFFIFLSLLSSVDIIINSATVHVYSCNNSSNNSNKAEHHCEHIVFVTRALALWKIFLFVSVCLSVHLFHCQ